MSIIVLDTIQIPFTVASQVTQSYSEIGGRFRRRMMDGTNRTQQHWNKLQTTITGQGWVGAGLVGLDYSQDMVLKCAAPRSISSTSNVIDIPSARRSDSGYEPFGFAIVGKERVPTPVSMNTDEATLTVVTGADLYDVHWFPQITVQADLTEDFNNGRWSWSIRAEEV